MKKAIYKKVDEKIELVTIHHEEYIDENGKVIPPCDEVIKKVIPIMGVVYEEMTDDEVAELSANEVPTEPTIEERLEALEQATLEMILGGM